MRQVAEFQRKHKNYERKLDSSVAVLGNNIVIAQSTIISEPSLGATIELGPYDADREHFELTAQDTASEKSPFYFKGSVGIPRDTAKIINRAAPGIIANLQFINYPFKADSVYVNLAMSRLSLSRNGLDLKVEGSFSEIERYKSIEGYGAWKLRADSLLSGSLKPKADAVPAPPPSTPATATNWLKWTRIAAFAAAAVFGGVAVYKHLEAQDSNSDLDKLQNNPDPGNEVWDNKYDKAYDSVKDSESQRNIFGGIAGAFAVGGIVTFFF